jgi:hypothetical protein
LLAAVVVAAAAETLTVRLLVLLLVAAVAVGEALTLLTRQGVLVVSKGQALLTLPVVRVGMVHIPVLVAAVTGARTAAQ